MSFSPKPEFKKSAGNPKKKRPAPFPIRLSAEERAFLEAKAGNKPLGAYIRDQLLGEAQSQRKTKKAKPKADYLLMAEILGKLGQSDQVKCLLLLLIAAEGERVSLSLEDRMALVSACEAVKDMRTILVSALGLKSGSGS